MTDVLLAGVDGSDDGKRAAEFAASRAKAAKARLVVAYVIEWSPYTFNTPEENEERHKRREQEISLAQSSVLDPALKKLKSEGIDAKGIVRHGNVADVLNGLAIENNAVQIVVGRIGTSGLKSLIFGSVTSKLVQVAAMPVTVVP